MVCFKVVWQSLVGVGGDLVFIHPCVSYHHPLVFVDARNTQNEITLDGFRNMVQDFTDVPQVHVCICVCCLLHERGVESDMFGG
jgi:hypothetical protein